MDQKKKVSKLTSADVLTWISDLLDENSEFRAQLAAKEQECERLKVLLKRVNQDHVVRDSPSGLQLRSDIRAELGVY